MPADRPCEGPLVHQAWLKQTSDKPAFADLLWSRPENRAYAGKLMIAGGSGAGFTETARAYGAAMEAGIGTARVLLPNALEKTVGWAFDAGEFTPSTPSGSFSRQSVAPFLDTAAWADGVLLAGGFGKNSETSILQETFLQKYHRQLTLCGDAVDSKALDRAETTMIVSFKQLQRLFIAGGSKRALVSNIGLVLFVELLQEFTTQHAANVVLCHDDVVIVACGGQVSTTDSKLELHHQQDIAGRMATWWLQQPGKTFEALTTALI